MELNTIKLKKLRAEKGWTQQQLAEICSLSLRTIQRVEISGIASLETSKALAAAYELERSSLMLEVLSIDKKEKPNISVWIPVLTFLLGLFAGGMLLKIISA
jgi:transcriptional regulator with XRE-family HTH domain